MGSRKGGVTAAFLRVDGEDVGHCWYSHVCPPGWTTGAWYGALFSWATNIKPLGPYKTERGAKKAVYRTWEAVRAARRGGPDA